MGGEEEHPPAREVDLGLPCLSFDTTASQSDRALTRSWRVSCRRLRRRRGGSRTALPLWTEDALATDGRTFRQPCVSVQGGGGPREPRSSWVGFKKAYPGRRSALLVE